MSGEQTFWLVAMGIAAAFVATLWLIYWVYRARLLEREERRLMIERGMTPSPPPPVGWPGVRTRELELKAEERRLLIEKGLQPGPPEAVADVLKCLAPTPDPNTPDRYLRRGLSATAFGLGLAAAYLLFEAITVNPPAQARNWFILFAVISPVIMLYGASNLLHYRLLKNSAQGEAPNAPDPAR
jgi:hypothetical protein